MLPIYGHEIRGPLGIELLLLKRHRGVRCAWQLSSHRTLQAVETAAEFYRSRVTQFGLGPDVFLPSDALSDAGMMAHKVEATTRTD
jgi:hypothetical protein